MSRRALGNAERGTYSERSLSNMTAEQVDANFTRTKHGYQVKPRIRRMISFAQMNLAESVYVGKIDCIFCMNVLMYFSAARRLAILRQFYEALEPGGYFLLGHSETLSNVPIKFESIVHGDCRIYRKPVSAEARPALAAAAENSVIPPNQEAVEMFLQESSEHLQYLREYSCILQEPQPSPDDLEKLYISSHTLAGTSGSYGFPQFSEVAAKMAHIFHYAMNAALGPEMQGPLAEFISDAISVLEFDLLQISSSGAETADDIAAFKQRYAFAFPVAPGSAQTPASPEEQPAEQVAEQPHASASAPPEVFHAPSFAELLPEDADVPAEVLEFFIPEAEEHLQTVTECLLVLEAHPNPEDINRLFRSMHTIKGSAAQVGLHRLSAVAHRVEDLIGRLRDGALQPNAEIVDICLQSVDILKKFLHRLWDERRRNGRGGESVGCTDRIVDAPRKRNRGARSSNPPPRKRHRKELNRSRAGSPSATPASASPSTPAAPQTKSVRISLDRLDRMMNAVGELVINRTRMLGRLAELSKLVEVLSFSKGRLAGKVSEFQEKHEFNRISSKLVPGSAPPQMDTFRGRFRPLPPVMSNDLLEFSELEMDRYDDFNILSRSLTEISADVNEVLTQLESFMGRVDTDIDEFTKLAHHLQDEITAARMVPIGALYTRLSRTVRDASKAAGKSVELFLEGAETELDNNIIQHVSDPLIHIVRNAVAHGIEDPQTRRDAGKQETGHVSVRAYHRGNHIFIEVEDDGRGIDYEKVRQGVIGSGAMSPDGPPRNCRIANSANFFSGRDFPQQHPPQNLPGAVSGLDVVRSNVHALNGEIDIRSETGTGAPALR